MKQLYFILITCFLCLDVQAQKTVSRKVMLEDEGEAIGAPIIALGNESIQTTTEFDGTFSLEVPNDVEALVIYYTGFLADTIFLSESEKPSITLFQGDTLKDSAIPIDPSIIKENTVSGDDIASTPVVINSTLKIDPHFLEAYDCGYGHNKDESFKVIQGRIILKKEGVAIGARVTLKGNGSLSVFSDLNGLFTILIPKNEDTLLVTYGGSEPLEVSIKNKNNFTLILSGKQKIKLREKIKP